MASDFGSFWSVLGGQRDAVSLERCAGKQRAETVMQLAAQTGPFLLGGVDHALAGSLHVLRQRLRVQHDRKRRRHEIHHLLVGSREPALAPPWCCR